MKIKRVLVTGGAGYVGAVLVPKLVQDGYKVTVLDLFLYGDDVFDEVVDRKNLTLVKGDIRDANIVRQSLDDVDAVIHLACISNDPSFELDPKLGKSINYDATRQLIDLSKKHGIKRFIYASSSSVYGIKNEHQVTEDLTLRPLTDYSRYKVFCEKYLLSMQSSDFTAVVLRPATVCGWSPRMRLDLTVNILTINALVNKKIIVNGGSQKRPNIHIEDMCRAYILTLSAPKRKIAGHIFNVGYQNYTILALARMVKKVLQDSQIEIDIQPTNDNRSYHVSSEKIKRVLGFVPRQTIADAIHDIKTAYEKGKLAGSVNDVRYSNIKTMQKLKVQ